MERRCSSKHPAVLDYPLVCDILQAFRRCDGKILGLGCTPNFRTIPISKCAFREYMQRRFISVAVFTLQKLCPLTDEDSFSVADGDA